MYIKKQACIITQAIKVLQLFPYHHFLISDIYRSGVVSKKGASQTASTKTQLYSQAIHDNPLHSLPHVKTHRCQLMHFSII